jgi:hypothetical protein
VRSIKLTEASRTPGVRVSARCTLAWHAAQVMPPTGISSVSTAAVVPPAVAGSGRGAVVVVRLAMVSVAAMASASFLSGLDRLSELHRLSGLDRRCCSIVGQFWIAAL